jgi:hypothetical protein
VVEGLVGAHLDATLLRVLPLVLVLNRSRLDWGQLKELARRQRVKAELGMLLELTAKLGQLPELLRHANDLKDRRRKAMTFFQEPKSRFERELTKRHTPSVAKKWGFWLNMGEDAFLQTLSLHRDLPRS